MAVTLMPMGLSRPLAALALCGPVLAAPCAMAMGAAAAFTPPARVVIAAASPASAPVPSPTADPVALSGAAAQPPAPAASGLNGIRLGTQPRALIDGDWIALGGSVRGARLNAVRSGEAQLRHPDGRLEQLRLAPQVELFSHPLPSAARSGAAHPWRLSESP